MPKMRRNHTPGENILMPLPLVAIEGDETLLLFGHRFSMHVLCILFGEDTTPVALLFENHHPVGELVTVAFAESLALLLGEMFIWGGHRMSIDSGEVFVKHMFSLPIASLVAGSALSSI